MGAIMLNLTPLVFPRQRAKPAVIGAPQRLDQNTPQRASNRWRTLIVCTHLRPGRVKRSSHYLMQPLTGLHIGSLIDQQRFDVELYHEDWHGPFNPQKAAGYDLVFLTGLQPDFDRMRQLAYFFRRTGATVVGGGSICTVFPEFATQFFDVVCAGGVDSVKQLVDDYERGTLRKIYRSPITNISSYAIDYSLLRKSGINLPVISMEASRGCSFKCTFCVIPSEAGGHASYNLDHLSQAIDSAIDSSPLFSFRRWYPTIMFLDNNFADDRAHMLKILEFIRSHPKIRGWAALVTQNILRDRELVELLARSKCFALFVGLESLDPVMLRRYNKTQNLSRNQNIIDDIAFCESRGIGISYGYLFDPRSQTASAMEQQITLIARNPTMPMPIYLSVVAPLAGTESFWVDLAAGQLRPNLRLRDLDGEAICYSPLADSTGAIVTFIEKMFRRPWEVVGRLRIFIKTVNRIVRSGTLNPVRWHVMAAANLHCFVWSSHAPAQPRTYLAGTDSLDPQYFERPTELDEVDRERYFEPIALTDDAGRPVEWLQAYVPGSTRKKRRPALTEPRPDSFVGHGS
jgi:hypothetical protein